LPSSRRPDPGGLCLILDSYEDFVSHQEPGRANLLWRNRRRRLRALGGLLAVQVRRAARPAGTLYATQPAELAGQTAELGQALADVATIGILHERALHRREAVTEQMQRALSSRITIEQAKGVLAERLHVTIEEAFTLMRAYARDHSLKLGDIARAITAGQSHITPLG
jgi:ANTAR domain